MTRFRNDKALAIAAFVTVCILWGTTYLGIRVAVQSVPPILMTGVRYTIGGIVLLTVLKLRGHSIPTDRRTLANVSVVALLLIAGGNLLLVVAEQWVPSGMAALLVAAGPFWAALIEASRRNGERIRPMSLAGMLIGFGGVALLLLPSTGGHAIDRHLILGAILIQFGAIAWQGGSIYSKVKLTTVSPLMSAALEAIIGGIVLDVAGVLAGEVSRLHPTPVSLVAWVYLTIAGTIIGYSAYTVAVSKIPITTMSLYTYVNPVIAVLLGWLILDERLTPLSIVGMAVILIGMTLVQSARQPAPVTLTFARPNE